MRDATEIVARWPLRLSEADFEAVDRPVVKHQIEEALFRLSATGADGSTLEDYLHVLKITDLLPEI